jgi:tripartite-type tricarboxylate transporter receptor subunit TctC
MFRRWVDSLGVNVAKTRAIQLKSGAEVVTLTAGGHVSIGVSAWTSIGSAYQAKRVRLLAVAGSKRFPDAPEIPTMAEAGYPQASTTYWLGVSGPPNLPPDIARKWEETVADLLKDDKVVAQMAKLGLVPDFRNEKEMKQLVLEEKGLAERLWPH